MSGGGVGAVGGSGGPGLAADHAEEVPLEVLAETAEKKKHINCDRFHVFVSFYLHL